MGIIATYNRVARYYDLLDEPMEDGIYSHMRSDWVPRYKDKRILEIGVGTGKNLPFYHPSNSVIAIDLSSQMLYYAAKRKAENNLDHVRLVEAGVNDLLHSDVGRFDVIIATFVIYLNDHPEKMITDIMQLLSPTGKLLIFEFRQSSNLFLYYFTHAISPITNYLFNLNFKYALTLPKLVDRGYKITQYKEYLPDLVYAVELTLE